MNGPAGLREALMKHQDVVLLSFTENLMTYALGRRLEAYRHADVRAIVRDAAAKNLKLSAFVMASNSPAFRMAAPDVPIVEPRSEKVQAR
jgi:hypothetical protein